MKYISALTLLIFFVFSNSINAQNSPEVKVGETLSIGSSDNYLYSDVKFPKPNFIIKQGGIANYKKLEGTLVEVSEIRKNSKDQTVVILKRKDGKKFFGSFSAIRANYENALASGELSL